MTYVVEYLKILIFKNVAYKIMSSNIMIYRNTIFKKLKNFAKVQLVISILVLCSFIMTISYGKGKLIVFFLLCFLF